MEDAVGRGEVSDTCLQFRDLSAWPDLIKAVWQHSDRINAAVLLPDTNCLVLAELGCHSASGTRELQP